MKSNKQLEQKVQENPDTIHLDSSLAIKVPCNDELGISKQGMIALHYYSLSIPLTSIGVMIRLVFVILCTYYLGLSEQSLNTCRSYCGNITIDYPFAVQHGCGHPGFRDLLFCMNDVLMFHISSGSYRVLEIDYAYQALTLHEPHMSTCDNLFLGTRGNGFSLEPWRAPYINPAPDNVFMLIACSPRSPLFQGFPGKHLPCRNVSGMGCQDYYACPAWDMFRPSSSSFFGSGPPECCAIPYEAIRGINLTKLQCQGYSSAYTVAPLKLDGPAQWSYGIRLRYSLQGNDEFCGACEATAGTCGYASDGIRQLCMCGDFNSTSNCDSLPSISQNLVANDISPRPRLECTTLKIFAGLLAYVLVWKAS